jgi:predicted aspartyl protease
VNLVEFLHSASYRQLPLQRSGVGHLSARGTLNGRPVSVLMDTGGASSVISLALAEELGITLTKMPFQGGGAGAARLDVYHVADASLQIGEIVPRTRALMAMDLTHVNAALALKGESESQAAVIDYASSSLFLKP